MGRVGCWCTTDAATLCFWEGFGCVVVQGSQKTAAEEKIPSLASCQGGPPALSLEDRGDFIWGKRSCGIEKNRQSAASLFSQFPRPFSVFCTEKLSVLMVTVSNHIDWEMKLWKVVNHVTPGNYTRTVVVTQCPRSMLTLQSICSAVECCHARRQWENQT